MDIETSIKEYFKGKNKYSIKNLFKKFIEENFNIVSYLNKILEENKNWENIRNIVYSICLDENLSRCKTCGKEMKYSQRLNGYCCLKCSKNNEEAIRISNEKRLNTNMERFGVSSPMKLKEYQDKYKATCEERYGVDNIFKCEDIIERIQETVSKKRNEITKKIRETTLKKYGVENVNRLDEVKEKIKNTKSKFTKEIIEEIENKKKQTSLERYGVEYFSKTIEAREGISTARHENLWKTILTWKDYVIPLFEKEELKKITDTKTYRWKCVKCGNEFESHIHKTCHMEKIPYLPRCPICYEFISGASIQEKEIVEFCRRYFDDIIEKDRKLIKPLELDVVIPKIKLAIEFNGDYWHSLKEPGYHLNKTILCNSVGYRLIHIWEDEWKSNKENIKNKLIDIFKGNENLNFEEDEIKLDRSWYNNIEIQGYLIEEETNPKIVLRNNHEVENCGYFVMKKINNINKNLNKEFI